MNRYLALKGIPNKRGKILPKGYYEPLRLGDFVDFDNIVYRRGHLRKILKITKKINTCELLPLLKIPYNEKAWDRIKQLKDANTSIGLILKADVKVGKIL